MKAKRNYRHLFFDLDHTIWDFEANSKATLSQLFTELELEKRGVHDFELFHKNYIIHNDKLWERYRNGFIKQEELRVKRMRLTLLDFKIADEKLEQALSVRFLDLLPTRNILFDGAIEVLDYLTAKNYQLHLITNGFEKVQFSKLKYSGLESYFKEVITSEGSGSLKPKPEIFEYAFAKAGATKDESIMIGDTVEVDILGAMNAGIDQVYVNHVSNEIVRASNGQLPTYTVYNLIQLKEIF
jgi:putative hydrolase of the HAD superfamily